MCSTTNTAAAKSPGNPEQILLSASTPPVELPIAMTFLYSTSHLRGGNPVTGV
jgi:hypothetical protein